MVACVAPRNHLTHLTCDVNCSMSYFTFLRVIGGIKNVLVSASTNNAGCLSSFSLQNYFYLLFKLKETDFWGTQMLTSLKLCQGQDNFNFLLDLCFWSMLSCAVIHKYIQKYCNVKNDSAFAAVDCYFSL